MRLSEFLRSDFVVSHLEARDVEGVLEEVSAQAGSAGVAPKEIVAQKLLEREKLHTTVMGAGLAIPHATVPGLSAPVLGVALAREPIAFGPEDADPVRVFVVLLSPPGHEREHVKILARICRLTRHDRFIDRLEAATDEEGVIQVIEAIDAQHA
jgi:mannitol/fructose-specific phosphotransferase system IIA component (Ntr-type)